MKRFYQENTIELGIDEAGRGCLLGPLCVGAVIMSDIESEDPPYEIKDSKKCSPKIRKILREYIENNSIAYNVQFVWEKEIDEVNVLQATMNGMHRCVDEITKEINIDRILVDGTQFNTYLDSDFEPIEHICVPQGDNIYTNIAAASILAKEYHDEYIVNLVKENPELEEYDILNNKGYGTKNHINKLKDNKFKEIPPTEWHRKSFIKNYI
jgi:ribonuclease HII